MFRLLAAPVAYLALAGLAGPAVAQDRPGPTALAAPEGARPEFVLDSLALRQPEPEAAQITSALRSPAELPDPLVTNPLVPGHLLSKDALRPAPRPWCAQERRVGTGAGFCLIN